MRTSSSSSRCWSKFLRGVRRSLVPSTLRCCALLGWVSAGYHGWVGSQSSHGRAAVRVAARRLKSAALTV